MKLIFISLSIIIILGLLSIIPFYVYGTSDEVECRLEEKERVVKSSSSKYLIFCEDEVLENTDSFLRLKFNSSDFYKDLKVGDVYSLKVYGWRIPFFSMYRNIYQLENISP